MNVQEVYYSKILQSKRAETTSTEKIIELEKSDKLYNDYCHTPKIQLLILFIYTI